MLEQYSLPIVLKWLLISPVVLLIYMRFRQLIQEIITFYTFNVLSLTALIINDFNLVSSIKLVSK